MTKRKLLAAVAGFTLAAGVVVLGARSDEPPPSVINVASYEKIQVGMTRPQVEKILGGPPRNESKPNRWCMDLRGPNSPNVVWFGPEAIIHLWFDESGRVCHKDLDLDGYFPYPQPSLWDRVRAWLP